MHLCWETRNISTVYKNHFVISGIFFLFRKKHFILLILWMFSWISRFFLFAIHSLSNHNWKCLSPFFLIITLTLCRSENSIFFIKNSLSLHFILLRTKAIFLLSLFLFSSSNFFQCYAIQLFFFYCKFHENTDFRITP